MAKFFLAMPISQTADEQSFSISKRTLKSERASLDLSALDALFLKNWISTGILKYDEIMNISKIVDRE